MKLGPEDYPLIVEGNRIYTQRKADGQVLVAIDDEMAQDVARLLNLMSGMVLIPEYDLGNPDHVAKLMREIDERKP